MVINCSSTGVVTRISVHVGSCWISASALGSDHCWSSGISRNARFSPQKKKKKKGGLLPVSHVTPLQPTSHSQEPSPSIPPLHFPWTQAHAAGRDGDTLGRAAGEGRAGTFCSRLFQETLWLVPIGFYLQNKSKFKVCLSFLYSQIQGLKLYFNGKALVKKQC